MENANRVLIVEDEAVFAMLLDMRLERAGLTVSDIVSTGEEAVTAAERDFPDFALMDIRLGGGLDGIEAAQLIKTHGPCKIIFMTGYSSDETKRRAAMVEPVAYLVKPFDIRDLICILKSA